MTKEYDQLLMADKLTLFAFRYAVENRSTRLAEVLSELEDRLPTLPRFVVSMMLRGCEREDGRRGYSWRRDADETRRRFAGLCEAELLRRGPEVAHG